MINTVFLGPSLGGVRIFIAGGNIFQQKGVLWLGGSSPRVTHPFVNLTAFHPYVDTFLYIAINS